MNTAEQTPLYQARLENVKLVTELRELQQQIDSKRDRTSEIRVWQKRFWAARDRAEAHRNRILVLENAISDWLVGDLDENGLADMLGKVKQAA